MKCTLCPSVKLLQDLMDCKFSTDTDQGKTKLRYAVERTSESYRTENYSDTDLNRTPAYDK